MTIHKKVSQMIATTAIVFGATATVAVPISAAAHHRRHHSHHRSSSAIPQHNGGDRDADNNGAPSDGDGNV
jgi:hypothetical protein